MATTDLGAYPVLVADHRRREILLHLHRTDGGSVAVDDLVDRLAEAEESDPMKSPVARDQLAIQLYHRHLPLLAEHGVVDFDFEGRTVRYRPDERLTAVLDTLAEAHQRPNLET